MQAVTAVAGLSLAGSAAFAIEVGTTEIPTLTLAERERLKSSDNAKQFGAEAVWERKHSNPEGVRVGNFIFFPTVGTLVRYDDNIFATAANRKKDAVSELMPELKIKSDTGNHEFDLTLSGKLVAFAEHEDQNYTDLTASARAALHFDHAHTLSASVLSMLRHENGLDPGFPQDAARPVEYLYNRASAGITRDAGQLYGTFSTTVASWEYKDAIARDGSRIDQSYRNSELVKAQISGGYRFSPGYSLVARTALTRIWNEGTPERTLDSLGYEAFAGIRGELSPVLRWEILGGWGSRDYNQHGLATLNTSLFEGRLTWLATQRLTLHGIVGRSISDQVDSFGTGRVDTTAGLRADAELLHNLVLHLKAEVRDSEFAGQSLSTRTLSGGVGLDYHFSENWLFTISYDYQQRWSSLPDDDVTRNRISIGAKLRF